MKLKTKTSFFLYASDPAKAIDKIRDKFNWNFQFCLNYSNHSNTYYKKN